MRQEVEQQRAETGEQQRGAYRQAREDRHEDRGAEHREHVLEAEHEHLGRAELSGVVNSLGAVMSAHRRYGVVLCHKTILSLRVKCKLLKYNGKLAC